MPGVRDVDQSVFVERFASVLKRKQVVEAPSFTLYCKTSHGKELAPYNKDWFFVRMAALARRLYIDSNMGVGYFKKIYGTGKRNGTRPKHHVSGSGSVARKALQALEKLNIVKIDDENGGRIMTSSGRKEMDALANKMLSKKLNSH
ncbi:hypothetical protein HZS_5668 [Henneguya salminicola]|uniref:40S ribosomal protein S19-1 (Trinotate prediction) n=1 Tax=Henneguya salminicola TaxID=69463 RepID=A0A6G3MLN0_HENSL|nr:hypothetical protein HZS_5668 [Henneguya salminicola]